MDRRKFVRASMGVVAMSALYANSPHDSPVSGLPLLSVDESARLGEKLGIDRAWSATSNVCRGPLHSPSAAAGFYGVTNAS
jgi:hypothetical protein